ncbi:hypothetical protein HUU53_03860 [Candidatus Micrarchaeota archaeon]|nr:hypothetical protein [Candidatus Micrarchaeota archaeon]
MKKLEKIINDLDSKLKALELKQDETLALNREVVRLSARAIRDLHTNNEKECKKNVSELEKKVSELKKIKEFDNIARGALQEFVEIKCLFALLEGKEIPSYEELGVSYQVWLSGLSDCVGELRRALLIAIKNSDSLRAEELFSQMENIYDNLMVLKYSSSLVGDLKRKQDLLRGMVEASRSDLLRLKN